MAAPPAPVPVSKKRALGELDERLKVETKAQKVLESEVEDLHRALKDNRKALRALSSTIQTHEKKLLTIENRIVKHEAELDGLEDKLQEDYKSIGHLILAMNRLKDVPVEALVLTPGAPLETAQSGLVLKRIMNSLNVRSHQLKENIARQQVLSVSLKDDRAEVVASLDYLGRDRTQLSTLIRRKEALHKQSASDVRSKQAEIARISKDAKNVRDLMARLEQKRKANLAAAKEKKNLAQVLYDAPSKLLSGQSQLPISGIIRVGYGQKDHLDADSKGLWIEGRQSSLVVAPMKGVVRFAGSFKSYGNIVIIEHAGNYHSLIAGLEKIDAAVGYEVAAGEPLGYLGVIVEGANPRLYFELRRHGKAVNPSQKFAGIS